ncbi:hypothetical protein ABZ847_02555 [Streptomyces bauhiniae]
MCGLSRRGPALAGVTVTYTYDGDGNLTRRTDATGTIDHDYSNDDVRKTTTYPGGTVQKVDVDNSSRPKSIKVTSGQGTLVDLDYARVKASSSATPCLSAKTTAGTDMGFNREPGGTLNSSDGQLSLGGTMEKVGTAGDIIGNPLCRGRAVRRKQGKRSLR